ncbi:hypothetical protein M9458_033867, partial [Cirrhinus mrigala]
STTLASGSPMALPACYSGEAAKCNGFLLQCTLYFEMQPQRFPTERSKTAFITSLLSGRALDWADALWQAENPIIGSLTSFVKHFKEVFGKATGKLSPSDELYRLRQGSSSVSDYTLRFRTVATLSGWNEPALCSAYRQGLNISIRQQLVIFDDAIGLEALMQKTVQIAQRLSACVPESHGQLAASPNPDKILPTPEPMQTDSYHLSATERIRRVSQGLCLYCGENGHALNSCPVRPPRPFVSIMQVFPDVISMSQLSVRLLIKNSIFTVKALVDSGASGNFISFNTLKDLNLPALPQEPQYRINTIRGEPLGPGRIKHRSPVCQLRIGNFHSEEISFLVLEGATVDIVLGRPWLVKHSPIVDWTRCDILRWSPECHKSCLQNLPIPNLQLQSTLVESPESYKSTSIPEDYRAFQDVFSKQAATKLPPHRPWDCAIDLLPGAKLPKGKIYPLSIPEQKAMEEYIKEALQQGFIVPSTSPAASSFFFVEKKDGGLRPCIDYRVLNSQTIKFPYPLPLVPAALEELRGARIFSKLDLRSAYNLVRIHSGDEWKTAFITPAGHYHYRVMPYGLVNAPSVFQSFMNEVFREFLHQFVVVYIDDILIYSRNLAEHRHHVAQVLLKLRQHHLYLKAEKCEFHQNTIQFLGYVIGPDGISMDTSKVAAIRDWPQPTSVKELQRFLGFANFYRRFINQFSLLSATLTNLLKDKPKTLTWTPSASQAFASLKSAFCTAPALVLPDPQEPFIVEVDASTIGAGAVLSQYSGEPPKLHPCAFFSRKFSPAEQNYDIGNRELLAIKLALEEWRHWLEGARHPFSVITDHRNLEYIREAKRLNPRQARWALFFSRFRFTITYRPGHKNVKADALSRLHQPDLPTTSDPILPPEHFLCPIIWDLDRQLQEATSLEPVPPGGPEDKVYVPSSMRSALLDSVHSSPGSGHPGSKRTLSLLRSRFWWPQMAREVSQHVHACSVCAMTNTPRQLPCGKLVPLPIPTRPWSHIGIDFVTDLPSSNNYTCILVIVDRFSKSCKFIPLSCLPTAMETAEALLHSIFRYYGLPEDIVSDRGPQFISRVWHAFFRNLQISVSLSSGYHPQTNGQTERKIQELGRYLRAYCSSNQHDWSRYLPWAEYAQNSLRQSTTGLTPFQCVLGYQPALFPWSGEPSNVPAVDHWFRESERVWDSAHVHLQHAVRSHKIFADVRRRPAPTFQPGELVWLSTKDIRLRLPCKKLSPRYIGPFPIQRQLNPVTYQLQLPSHYRIHPAFHVSLLKPATNPPLPPSTESDGTEVPPPPEILEDPSIYRVKEILDSRRRGGQIEYLIDWEGYGPEERSWIPRKDILDPTLLSEFHQQHPERPAPRPRGRPRHHFRASGAALPHPDRQIPSPHPLVLNHQPSDHRHLHSITAHLYKYPGLSLSVVRSTR